MAKIKQVAKYDGSSWGTPYDLGADAENIDVVTGEDPTTQEEITDNLQNVIDNIQEDISDIQTDLENKVDTEDLSGFDFTKTYLETTGNSANTVVNGISQNADTSSDIALQAQAVAGESTLTLWNKFNKFVQRVGNKFNEYTTTANLNTLLSNKVTRTGDTMSNTLYIKASNVSDADPVSAATYGPGITLKGSDDYLFGAFQSFKSTTEQGTYINGRRNVNGTNVNNYLSLKVDSSGNPIIGVASPTAWTTAIGAATTTGLANGHYSSIRGGAKTRIYTTDDEGGNIRFESKSGYATEMDSHNDTQVRIVSRNAANTAYHSLVWERENDYNLTTMKTNGEDAVKKSGGPSNAMTGNFYIKSSGITDGSTPTGSDVWGSAILFGDKNNAQLGYIQPAAYTDGRQGLNIGIRNSGNVNSISLYDTSAGTRSVSVSSPSAWRSALSVPAVSYSSPTLATGLFVNAGTQTFTSTYLYQVGRIVFLHFAVTFGSNSSSTNTYINGDKLPVTPMTNTIIGRFINTDGTITGYLGGHNTNTWLSKSATGRYSGANLSGAAVYFSMIYLSAS